MILLLAMLLAALSVTNGRSDETNTATHATDFVMVSPIDNEAVSNSNAQDHSTQNNSASRESGSTDEAATIQTTSRAPSTTTEDTAPLTTTNTAASEAITTDLIDISTPSFTQLSPSNESSTVTDGLPKSETISTTTETMVTNTNETTSVIDITSTTTETESTAETTNSPATTAPSSTSASTGETVTISSQSSSTTEEDSTIKTSWDHRETSTMTIAITISTETDQSGSEENASSSTDLMPYEEESTTKDASKAMPNMDKSMTSSSQEPTVTDKVDESMGSDANLTLTAETNASEGLRAWELGLIVVIALLFVVSTGAFAWQLLKWRRQLAKQRKKHSQDAEQEIVRRATAT